ncbi:MAG TPA: hypothetical protein PLI95_04505 [Polyangiaceae bacterium]|nr:hypothetical protein [Polyangiaceae bacterium]
MADAAQRWETMKDGPAAAYLFRNGVAHLLEAGNLEGAKNLLTHFDYLMTRLRVLLPLGSTG